MELFETSTPVIIVVASSSCLDVPLDTRARKVELLTIKFSIVRSPPTLLKHMRASPSAKVEFSISNPNGCVPFSFSCCMTYLDANDYLYECVVIQEAASECMYNNICYEM